MKPDQRCETCRHFGELRGNRGVVRGTVCLAPTIDGERFVYLTSATCLCELWTPLKEKEKAP